MNTELINKLHEKTEIKDGHWLYRNTNTKGGYGYVGHEGSNWSVHRLSLSLFLKLNYRDYSWQANHLCNYKNCWNPLHLYVGTQKDNVQDSNVGLRNKQKTHCPLGHEYTPENTYTEPSGKRRCIICKRKALDKYRKKG